MGYIRKLKKNNRGSTLALAMIAIAFVGVIATVVISMSVGNVTLKKVENSSKKTFYTAESALDELYTGLGMTCMDGMGHSYEQVLSNLVRQDETYSYNYMIDNETANYELKGLFINNVLADICENDGTAIVGGSGVFEYVVPDTEAIMDTENLGKYILTTLNSYIKNVDAAKVKSFSKIQAYTEIPSSKSYYIYIKDVVVSYQNSTGYFADVTVDMEIEYPNVNIDFTGVNDLRTFDKFSIIADGDITFGDSSAVNVNVNSNIIAGRDIEVVKGSQVLFESKEVENINVISVGSLVIQGDTSNPVKSRVDLSKADLWGENIILSKNITESSGIDSTHGSIFQSGPDSNVYIKDDLELNGKYSEVNILGDYYGYSYDGYTQNILVPASSSAIIVNGQYSKLSISSDKMVIGGHAYIKFDEDSSIVSPYMMGEALSIIGDQQMYNVLDEYIDDSGNVNIDNSFFAYTLLNSSEPYVLKNVDGTDYYYLNFSTKANVTKYVKAVLDDGYYNTNFPGQTAAQINQRNSLKETANTKIKNVLRGEAVSVTSNAYSMGAMVTAYDNKASIYVNSESYSETDVSYANGTGLTSADGFVLTSLNLKNRYQLLSKILLDLPDELDERPYIVNDIYEAVKSQIAYILRDQDLYQTAGENAVDFDLISSTGGYNDGAVPEKVLYNGEEIYAVAVDGSYTVPIGVDKGIILATGNITINHDFTGTIITAGTVIVSGNSTINNQSSYVDALTDKEVTEDFYQYFYAFKSSDGDGESIKVSNLKYSDMLAFLNWRKYDETSK